VLSLTCLANQQYDKAVDALLVEIEKTKDVYGPSSMQVADVMTNLASTYFNLGQFNDAENKYSGAMEIYEEIREDDITQLLKPYQIIFTGLGDIEYLRGNELAARENYAMLEAIFEQDMNAEAKAEYMPALKNLAMITWRLGDYENASRLLTLVKSTLENDPKYGQSHPQTLLVTEHLADLTREVTEGVFEKIMKSSVAEVQQNEDDDDDDDDDGGGGGGGGDFDP